MRNLVFTFLPDSALPLMIAVFGLLIVVRVVRPRTALGLIGLFVASMLIAPFIEELLAQLPFWLTALVVVGITFWAVRKVMEFTLGKHAAGHVIGTAFIAATRMVLLVVFLPFHLAARLLATRRNG